MPELPEVERAIRLLNEVGAGKTIVEVETTDDAVVYSGTTHSDFAKALTGRRLIGAHRYGKVFYMELEGIGKHPVMHFGMTGMLHVKGQSPMHYREAPSDATDTEWPPRWMKFVLHFADQTNGQITHVAFRDARRLGRIRLCVSPSLEVPISELGFDPIHSMPTPTEFSSLIGKRKGAAVKALLLDQSFSAGIGNWVADEVLYHARIHPEQRCNTLSPEQRRILHEKIVYVCKTATSVNADDSLFPENWLFKHRWGKGKKKKAQHILALPSGDPATIKWVTVGGRTSAYVTELQKLLDVSPAPPEEIKASDGTPPPGEKGVARKKRKRKTSNGDVEMPSMSPRRKSARYSTQK